MAPTMDFQMTVEIVFTIKGRGVVIGGKVQRGSLHKGEIIEITGNNKSPVRTSEFKFEGFIKDPDSWWVQAGDQCGLLLPAKIGDQVEVGMIVSTVADKT